MSRSDFILQQQQPQNLSQQRKATSLKTISLGSNQQTSKILYPIEFETNNIDQSWYQKRHGSSHNKVPTSDSGIVIDTDGTRPTSKSSIEEVRMMSTIFIIIITTFCFINLIKTCGTERRKSGSHISLFSSFFSMFSFPPRG